VPSAQKVLAHSTAVPHVSPSAFVGTQALPLHQLLVAQSLSFMQLELQTPLSQEYGSQSASPPHAVQIPSSPAPPDPPDPPNPPNPPAPPAPPPPPAPPLPPAFAQKKLSQSLSSRQGEPFSQGGQSSPPQSMSVSSAFCTPSVQLEGTHRFLEQSSPGSQSLGSRHSTQFPAPSHTPPSSQPVPSSAFRTRHTPTAQSGTAQTVSSAGQSLASTQIAPP
jgi:hypothetical protein